jgi:ribosome-associated protein
MRRREPVSELPDEELPPSRSQQRRDALEVFVLAETLAALSDAQLARVPLGDDLLAEVQRTRAVTSHIAR